MAEQSRKYIFLRLRNSTIPELAYRVKQAFDVLRPKILLKLKKNRKLVQVPIIDRLDVEILKLPSFHYQVDEDTLKAIIGGEILCLNVDRHILTKFEEKSCNIAFSDIKQSNPSLDIRTAWEPARLQHIAILAVYNLQPTKSPAYEAANQFARDAVLEWIEKNPFLLSPHYISAMECGLRIPVFFYCLKSLDDFLDHKYRLILHTIYLHGWWISKRLSLYSSLGNHTIAECIGLIFAGAVFRKTKEGQQWLERAFVLLRKELRHQILQDGGPAEQSFHYHRFVLDLYWLSVDFLERNNLYDCSDIKPRLILGEDFLNAFQDNQGNLPLIGDSDNGCAIAPGIAPRRPKTNRINRAVKVFKHSGYTVINTENRITFTFDHGPLGMPPLYNHGHADALSITLTKKDQQLLVDPGTFRYNGALEWRRYFKGTSAHNTVTIDGLDQAVQETSFIWSMPYKTELIKAKETNDRLVIEALHDGYSRLKMPVWHKRTILYLEGTNFLIKDTFWGNGIHNFEINYHLPPEASLTKIHGWWLIDNHAATVFIRLLGEYDFVIVRGQQDPPLGWYSPSYGIKKETSVLNCTRRGFTHEVSFITAICTESPGDVKHLQKTPLTV